MITYLTAYALTALVFFAIDFVWLTRVARSFYLDRLGSLMLTKPNLLAAGIFYALYVVGIVIFAVSPGLREQSAQTTLLYGALFGFFAYGTYDMTNLATLKNWSLTVTIVDILWGTALTAISALAGFAGTRLLLAG